MSSGFFARFAISFVTAAAVLAGQVSFANAAVTSSQGEGQLISISGFPQTADAVDQGLIEFARFVGKYTVSSDGYGLGTGNQNCTTPNSQSGTLQVQKPSGATVAAAYLTLPSKLVPVNSSVLDPAGTVTLDSQAVTFSHSATGNRFKNYFSDVTSLVSANINSQAAGVFDIPVTYASCGFTGIALTVIFEDLSAASGTTIFQFGHAATTGQLTTLNFSPINTAPVGTRLSLGIGWSAQGNAPTISGGINTAEGYNTLEISTSGNAAYRTISNWAGGANDSAGSDGYITVGGVGDNTNALPGSWSANVDDELYSLDSFLAVGDSSITLKTLNTFNDNDTIFQMVLTVPGVVANQTVIWAPNTLLNKSSSPATPSSVATTNGDGAITYSVVDAGSTGCTVNPTTGVVTYTAIGKCKVRATAAATATYGADSEDVTFEITSGADAETGLDLGLVVGNVAFGATINYAVYGLKPGTDWTLIVRSTPQTLATGTYSSGLVTGTATLPSNLEAGWHSITLTGTHPNGSTLQQKTWFKIDASGKILKIQTIEPTEETVLAKTGALAGQQSIVAVLLVISGIGLIQTRRRALRK